MDHNAPGGGRWSVPQRCLGGWICTIEVPGGFGLYHSAPGGRVASPSQQAHTRFLQEQPLISSVTPGPAHSGDLYSLRTTLSPCWGPQPSVPTVERLEPSGTAHPGCPYPSGGATAPCVHEELQPSRSLVSMWTGQSLCVHSSRFEAPCSGLLGPCGRFGAPHSPPSPWWNTSTFLCIHVDKPDPSGTLYFHMARSSGPLYPRQRIRLPRRESVAPRSPLTRGSAAAAGCAGSSPGCRAGARCGRSCSVWGWGSRAQRRAGRGARAGRWRGAAAGAARRGRTR